MLKWPCKNCANFYLHNLNIGIFDSDTLTQALQIIRSKLHKILTNFIILANLLNFFMQRTKNDLYNERQRVILIGVTQNLERR